MERLEQLKICEQCKDRNFDIPRGIYCGIHGDVPDFDTSCPDYKFSEKVKATS